MDLYVLLSKRWTPAVPLADSPRWARRYTIHVTLVSAMTAPCSLFLVALQSPAMTTFVTVVIMGSWTRAVQARWPLKGAMFGYGIPMMSGLIVALAWYGSMLNWFLAGFALLNLVLTLREGVKQNERLTASLMLQFENEALAAQLREQVAATERASAEKTRFLAAASHDLRQPMHAIALFGAALGSNAAPAARDPERGAADARGRCAGRLARHHARHLAPRRGRGPGGAARAVARCPADPAAPHLLGAGRAQAAAAARAAPAACGSTAIRSCSTACCRTWSTTRSSTRRRAASR